MIPSFRRTVLSLVPCIALMGALPAQIPLPFPSSPQLPLLAVTYVNQNQSHTLNFSRSIGNGDLGGTASAFAEVAASRFGVSSGLTKTARATFTADLKAKLLGHTAEVAEAYSLLSNTVSPSGQTRTASLRVEVLGNTIYSKNFSSNETYTQEWHYQLFPGGKSKTYWVGFVPVTVEGNASCNARVDMQLQLPANNAQVCFFGTARASAQGHASAYVGLAGLGAGLEVSGKIANQLLNLQTVINAENTNLHQWLWGVCNYRLDPIALKLRLAVHYLVSSSYLTVTEWSASPVFVEIFRIFSGGGSF